MGDPDRYKARTNGDGGKRRRPRYVDAASIADQLSISVRQAERMIQEGAFGPRLKIGHRTIRVQQAGVDLYLRRAERESRTRDHHSD